MKSGHHRPNNNRGSVLLVALLLCGIIGISLVSYIQLSRTTLNISNRGLYNNAAMNLAEEGLEEAMYSINQNLGNSTYTWPSWTTNGGDKYREWPTVSLSQGATATFRVYFYNFSPSDPGPKWVVSRSRVTLAGINSAPVDKYIAILLKKTSIFANGLVAKHNVDFHGNNAAVDSWNSDSDGNGVSETNYSTANTVRHAKGSVAAENVVSVQNADIFGYVATKNTTITVGSNGMITGNFSAAGGTLDSSRTSQGFQGDFTINSPPAGTYSGLASDIINTSTSLPRGTDTTTCSDTNSPYYGYRLISADSVSLAGSDTLTITNKVVIKLNSTTNALKTTGSSKVKINTGAALVVFTAGDINIAGNGVENGTTSVGTCNAPINCQFFGTKTSLTQSISIAGNGVLSAVVDAPFASVSINGGGDVCGSVVAYDIDVTGDAQFHYDESLANFNVDEPYRIFTWKELTTNSQRTGYLVTSPSNLYPASAINFAWP